MSSEINSASNPLPSRLTNPNTSSTTEMLTPSELGSLRQEMSEFFTFAREAIPKKLADRKAKAVA